MAGHGAVTVVNGDTLSGKQVVLFELLGFVRSHNVPGDAGGPFLGLSKLTRRTFNGITTSNDLGITAWCSALFCQPTKMGKTNLAQFVMSF